MINISLKRMQVLEENVLNSFWMINLNDLYQSIYVFAYLLKRVICPWARRMGVMDWNNCIPFVVVSVGGDGHSSCYRPRSTTATATDKLTTIWHKLHLSNKIWESQTLNQHDLWDKKTGSRNQHKDTCYCSCCDIFSVLKILHYLLLRCSSEARSGKL